MPSSMTYNIQLLLKTVQVHSKAEEKEIPIFALVKTLQNSG
jgi:hypothetical protein